MICFNFIYLFIFFLVGGGDESPLFGENKTFVAEPFDWPAIRDGTKRTK